MVLQPKHLITYWLTINFKCNSFLPPVGESLASGGWSEGGCGLTFRSWSMSWFSFSAKRTIYFQDESVVRETNRLRWIIKSWKWKTERLQIVFLCYDGLKKPCHFSTPVQRLSVSTELVIDMQITPLIFWTTFCERAEREFDSIIPHRENRRRSPLCRYKDQHPLSYIIFYFLMENKRGEGRGIDSFSRLCWFDVWLQLHLIYGGNQMNLMALGSLAHAWMPWMPQADKVEYIFVFLSFACCFVNPAIC